MISKICTFLLFAAVLLSQTRPPNTYEYVRFAGGTKTSGYCLTWDSSGRVTSATCGAGGGETNAGANLGTGAVIYTGKSGVNLQFRSITAGSNKLSVTQNSLDIAVDMNTANVLLSTLGGSLSLTQLAQGGATTGQLLQWNGSAWVPASTGGGGGPADTDALAEGATNLYFTQARARAALSVAGILSYNNGTGVFSCSNCADITSNYANPTWISSLAWAKLTGVPTYQLSSEKGAASGYASLNASTLVPVAQLGTGTANSTTFLRGDGTWTNPSGSVNALLAGVSVGTRPGMNFIAGPGFTWAVTDDAGNNRVNVTGTPDTAILLANAAHQAGARLYCRSTTGNDTYTCAMDPTLLAYTRGMIVVLDADTANTGTATLAVDGLTAISILNRAGSALADGDITANRGVALYYNGTSFNVIGDGSSSGGTTPSTRGAYASLPTCDASVTGQIYYLTNRGVDGKTAQCNGTSWAWYYKGKPIIEPPTLGSWTAVNTPNCADSAGMIVCTPAATGAQTYKSILLAIPTAPYTIEMDFGSYTDTAASGCGIVLTNGTTTASALKRLHFNSNLSGNQNAFDLQYWTSYTGYGGQSYTSAGSAGPNGTVKVKVEDDNTNRIWSVQTGGGTWLQILSESRTADLTPTHYGINCQLQAAGLAQFTLVNLDVY